MGLSKAVRVQDAPVLIWQPTKATLAKYGLSLDEWLAILRRQDYKCGACGKTPASGRMVIDHEHVKGYKKMPTEQRKLFVRGVLDWSCNHYRLGRGATKHNLKWAAQYLEDYEARRDNRMNMLLVWE